MAVGSTGVAVICCGRSLLTLAVTNSHVFDRISVGAFISGSGSVALCVGCEVFFGVVFTVASSVGNNPLMFSARTGFPSIPFRIKSSRRTSPSFTILRMSDGEKGPDSSPPCSRNNSIAICEEFQFKDGSIQRDILQRHRSKINPINLILTELCAVSCRWLLFGEHSRWTLLGASRSRWPVRTKREVDDRWIPKAATAPIRNCHEVYFPFFFHSPSGFPSL